MLVSRKSTLIQGTQFKRQEKFNVLAGILSDLLIDPYFIPDSLNDEHIWFRLR